MRGVIVSATTGETHEQNAAVFMRMALGELDESGPSRENSLARTNLEQALMWSQRDREVKHGKENQEVLQGEEVTRNPSIRVP